MDHHDTTRRRSTRHALGAALCVAELLLLSVMCLHTSRAIAQRQQAPAPIERRPPPTGGFGYGPVGQGNDVRSAPIQRQQPAARPGRGEHLAQWMNQHRDLTPQQQQQALQREPGFQNLPVQTQQRYLNRLAQLNAMPPARRERELARIEDMERLSPEQRTEVRGALGQLGSLPMDQRRAVARTFRALRDLPPEQRIPSLNSGRYGPPLNDQQRAVMYNLLRVEPMLPPPGRQNPAPVAPGYAPVPPRY